MPSLAHTHTPNYLLCYCCFIVFPAVLCSAVVPTVPIAGLPHRNLAQATKDWALADCRLTTASTHTCPAGTTNSCCDGTGCSSLTDNSPVTCNADQFIGCCGAGTTDYTLAQCQVTTSNTAQCPDNTNVACCDGTGCTGWADNSDIQCVEKAFIGCCTGGRKKK